MPPEREPHRTAGRARELGREERLDAGALLAAEAAADELGEHAHLLGGEAEAARELASSVEHALGRHPRGQLVAVPLRDRGVRLERGLHVRGRLAGDLDAHLGGRERRVGLAAHALARVVREALLVEARVDVERRGSGS